MGPGNFDPTTIVILYDEQKPLGQFFLTTFIVILCDEQSHGAKKSLILYYCDTV